MTHALFLLPEVSVRSVHRPAPRRWRITLRDGSQVLLRPIEPADKPLLLAGFARLSEESRYRRFFTTKSSLSEAELAYFVDVDHHDHEAIVAIDPSDGTLIGVTRYIRSLVDAQSAEVAVVVADDWQRRGLGRALLHRLTSQARNAGVRRFTAPVQIENRTSLGLLESLGNTHREFDTGLVELDIELPPKQGIGSRLRLALRSAANGHLIPAKTLAHRVSAEVHAPRPATAAPAGLNRPQPSEPAEPSPAARPPVEAPALPKRSAQRDA